MRRAARPMLYLGIAAVVLGLSKIHAGAIADPEYSWRQSDRAAWSIAYIALLAITAYGAGLPDIPRSRRGALGAAVGAAAAAALAMSVVQLVVGDALLPRFVVFGSSLLLVPWYLLCAAIASGGRARERDRDRVLVVGGGTDADDLGDELVLAAEHPASVIAVLRPTEVVGERGGSPLVEAARRDEVTVVVLDRDAQADPRIVTQAAELHESGVRVRTLSLFYEEWLGKLPLSELERVALLFDIGEVHRARYGRVKRLLDLVIAVVALPLFLLAIPLVALGDLFGNRGPLFFSQDRVGKHQVPFRILKFRTMRPGSADAGEWTAQDDPRITGFGRFLRRTHIDELPQVLNVLRGELSVVGPRPEQPHYVAELVEKLPFYDLRHLVRPGITGWAQVKYHYGSDDADAMEKLQYEFFYLRHQRLSFDLRIIGRTLRSVLGGQGR